MAKNTVNKNIKKEKPSFEEWYNGLSKPAKLAYKVGVQYAMKCMKDNQKLNMVLAK